MGSCASKDQKPAASSTLPGTASKKRQDQQQSLAKPTEKNGSTSTEPAVDDHKLPAKPSTGNGTIKDAPLPTKITSKPSESTLTKSSNGGITNSTNSSSTNSEKFVKVLLLGSGESGKSTIVKQMKILHQNGYTKEELQEYKPFVYRNLLECIKNIINAIMDLEPQLISEKKTEKPENEADEDSSDISHDGSLQVYEDGKPASRRGILDSSDLEKILEYDLTMNIDETFDPEIAKLIIKVYNTPEVQQFLKYNLGNFYLIDLSKYFLCDVERIAKPDYFPSIPDVLRTRKKTSGIYDFKFQMGKNLNIHMFDVGGQRSERKKWIHCFDNVTLIIFCVALSEYDQVLLEENTQNRLEESLTLFDSVVNSRWFLRSSIVLFLNKIDVFAEKLPYSPLENHFPDYNGGDNVNKAAKYILWRFTQVNRSGLNIYPHVTQATDTSNIELVFAAVKETILENSLRDSGLL